MTNQIPNPNSQKIYDLEERTAKFGEMVIIFSKRIPDLPVIRVLITQLIRAATSIGANYMEADAANSKRDFKHKIALCKKEAKETMHWLRMIGTACPQEKEALRVLWKEAHELVLIFSAILKK